MFAFLIGNASKNREWLHFLLGLFAVKDTADADGDARFQPIYNKMLCCLIDQRWGAPWSSSFYAHAYLQQRAKCVILHVSEVAQPETNRIECESNWMTHASLSHHRYSVVSIFICGLLHSRPVFGRQIVRQNNARVYKWILHSSVVFDDFSFIRNVGKVYHGISF